jgi:cellobiose-specific phosphotransferase system component IIA
MKKLILIAALLSFSALADPCKRVETTAKAIMEARQAEVEAHVVVSLYKEDATETELKIYIIMIHDAYNSALYNKKKDKKRAVKEYSNRYYMMCWKQWV